MAASCVFPGRKAVGFLAQNRAFVRSRHCHSQSLWEELLGGKIEPAAAKKLEEAFLEYKVRKAVPSWLPFFPNGSFWIPSSEETIKNLEVLAERIRVSKPSHKGRMGLLKPPPGVSDKDGLSKVAEWSVIQQTDRLLGGLSVLEVPAQEAIFKPLGGGRGGKVTVIEVGLDDDDDDDVDDSCDEDSEEEGEVVEKTKK